MALGMLPEEQSDGENEAAIFSEINITPLTDVFLVLLIIFMVSSSAINNSGVKVNLPRAGAAASSQNEKGVTVSLDSKGAVFVGSDPVSMEALEGVLRDKLDKQELKSVVLAGDQEVMLGAALTVMNIAKKAGAEKFGIATKGQGEKISGKNP